MIFLPLLIVFYQFSKKKSIELRGFGSFDIVLRKGRENARNPLTGEKVSVPDRHTVKFRPGREIKAALKSYN